MSNGNGINLVPDIILTQAELDALPITDDPSPNQKTLGRFKTDLGNWMIVGCPSIENGIANVIVNDKAEEVALKAHASILAAQRNHPGKFMVDEKIEIKGHMFKVAWIKKNRMLLKRINQ